MGSPRARASARTSRRDRSANASAATRRITSPLASRKIGGVERAGGGEGGEGLEPPAAARAGEAEIGDGKVHQVRVTLVDLGGREAMAARSVGPQVLDQDARALAEAKEAAPAAGVVQVELHAALVGVAVEEGERPVLPRHASHEGRSQPVGVATGGLHLDDVGAEVGEQPAGERAAQVGQVDDAQVGQGAGHAARRIARGRPPRPAPRQPSQRVRSRASRAASPFFACCGPPRLRGIGIDLMAAEKHTFADLRLIPRLRTATLILLGIVPLFLALDLRYQRARLPGLLVFYGLHVVVAGAALLATFTRAGKRRPDRVTLLLIVGVATNINAYFHRTPANPALAADVLTP